jgi:hypothetical protein
MSINGRPERKNPAGRAGFFAFDSILLLHTNAHPSHSSANGAGGAETGETPN